MEYLVQPQSQPGPNGACGANICGVDGCIVDVICGIEACGVYGCVVDVCPALVAP